MQFDQHKEKLVMVLMVVLIVSVFKAMLSLPINSLTALVLLCLSVLYHGLHGESLQVSRSHWS